MTAAPIRIWLEASHLGALRIGGWAFLRQDAQGLRGMAGGERTIDAERQGVAAFNDVLADLPDGAVVALTSASPLLLAIPGRIAKAHAGEDAPTENLDLWAKAAGHLRRLTLTVRRADPTPNSPTAFTAAWAERARDHARAKGAFKSPIPKPNLAKAGV
jgi:hypothetical protein